MDTTGIIRKVDDLGRIVLPVELRRGLEISLRDEIEISQENDKIVIRKHKPRCVFCGSNQELIPYEGKHICRACLGKLEEKVAAVPPAPEPAPTM